MMTVGDILKEYWVMAVAFVMTVIWLVRLEGRSVANEKSIKQLWEQRKEDLDAAQRARDETKSMLDEIRKDIKALLQKSAQ